MSVCSSSSRLRAVWFGPAFVLASNRLRLFDPVLSGGCGDDIATDALLRFPRLERALRWAWAFSLSDPTISEGVGDGRWEVAVPVSEPAIELRRWFNLAMVNA